MSSPTRRRGSLFVIAAPSGAGKTSLVKAVLARDPALRVSVSHTTRKQRETEMPGRDYNFVTVDEFKRLRDAGEFLEHAQVFDNFYGTGRAQVEALRNAGHDVILEIDWQGARQVRKAQPDCTTVFILPPSRARARNAAAQSQDRQRRGHRAAPAGRRRRYVALRGIRLRHRQRRIRNGRALSCSRSCVVADRITAPKGPSSQPLLADLLG